MPAGPTRSNYAFGGWYTAQDGGGTEFTASTPVSAAITVYAKWTVIQYTVTFNAGNGIPATQTRTVQSGASIGTGNMPAEPTRRNYAFGGWYTGQDGGGAEFTASTTVSAAITVYAKWAATGAHITLNPDAGAGAFSQDTFTVHKSGGTGSQTVSIDGSGYTSPRWFVDGNLKGTADSITINAADYGLGVHTLSLIIRKSGVSWSKELNFTVAP